MADVSAPPAPVVAKKEKKVAKKVAPKVKKAVSVIPSKKAKLDLTKFLGK